ncbi:hypothetical protein IWW36_001816 [Coemansia brasiliensis]|uniref:RGS domain-containing protein n=1 Tax=Coemansia brasiliensis TaxID=2650707 RepID=A0A9W8IFY9_9FUNG|nr:hypothetical protein IWW36_001816 [Coemansia brasiliensis]
MVRRYLRAKPQDASPFLGISECDISDSDSKSTNSTAPRDLSMRRETRLYYSKVPVPPLPISKTEVAMKRELRLHIRVMTGNAPPPSSKESQGGRPLTQRSQASSLFSTSSGISPLVVGTGGSAMGISQNSFTHTFVTTDLTTVEDLAREIEAVLQRQTGVVQNGILCTALFRGRMPLLFGQRVWQVLKSNDQINVYCGDDDSMGRDSLSSLSSDDVEINYTQNAGSGFVFVPLTEARHLQQQQRVASGQSKISIGRVDMSGVSSVCARAPLKARFINVLVTPPLLRAFMAFCALPSELALEALLFVLDVERFRHAQPSMARLLANYIYLSYIAPNAPLQINVSAMMRERIPWPFLPGWEYSPWVFDEILASVGFMLKKHTLLRFERSPVGLVSVLDKLADAYVKPLRLDRGEDPMAAIAAQHIPDIDVVVWVNELQLDTQDGVTALAQLSDSFREQLLVRVAAQFTDDPHKAAGLCEGYFQLANCIAPLQKQRKLQKTRKLRGFFGDSPHEALLRQQLMAVVPPSSHRSAARAAAELVARKRTAENRLRACEDLERQGSLSSSVMAEQKLIDSDGSDAESDGGCGWAHQAIYAADSTHIPQERSRSWSETSGDTADEVAALRRNNGWTTDDDDEPSNFKPQPKQRKGRSGVYNDQALSRALSMIGASYNDVLLGSSSSLSLSPTASPPTMHQRPALADDGGVQSFSVYTAHAQSAQSLGRRSKFSRFDRKRRADKLREFFGRLPQSSSPDPVSDLLDQQRISADDLSSATSSIPSLSLRSASFMRSDVPLTSEQRNILIRRRRKLKALLGEQVDECVVSFEPSPGAASSALLPNAHSGRFSLDMLGNSTYSLLTPEHTSLSSSLPSCEGAVDAHTVQIRQYSKIRSVLGENAPAPEALTVNSNIASDEQRVRARWRRNKLVTMLGDVPANVTTLYRTDARTVEASDVEDKSVTSPESEMEEPKYERRQRVKKLRHFFGQSLNSDAMLMQGISRAQQPATISGTHSRELDSRMPPILESHFHNADTCEDGESEGDEGSFELVPRPQHQMSEHHCSPHLDISHLLPEVDQDALEPVKAQFWMTSSPESQEREVAEDKQNLSSALMANLRAHKASIIGSIKRNSHSELLPQRSRASTKSSIASNASSGHIAHTSLGVSIKQPSIAAASNSKSATSSPGRLSFLSRKLGRSRENSPITKPRSLHRPSPLVPPARVSSSIKPLPPLPPITPNNLKASFDRGMALREIPGSAVSSPAKIDFEEEQSKMHFDAGVVQPPLPPPRISSAALSNSDQHHRQLISSALLSSASGPMSTRTRLGAATPPPPLSAKVLIPRTRSQSSGRLGNVKSVHWYDQRQSSPEEQLPSPLVANMQKQQQQLTPKASMEMGMAIVLRSPTPKSAAIKSPIISSQMARSPPLPRSRFPALPINSPPSSAGSRIPLSHKASVSAVGGRQLLCQANGRRSISRRLPLDTQQQSSEDLPPSGNTIVTIRARRSRSFAIQRKLELATSGRKRANTIGTGRQAETRSSATDAKQDGSAGIPQADRNCRRVRSMILSQERPAREDQEIKGIRSRCATVIPLHLELQRMLARRLASRRQTRALGLLSPCESSNDDAVSRQKTRLQLLRMTADALCAQDARLRTSVVLFGVQKPANLLHRRSCQQFEYASSSSAIFKSAPEINTGRHRSGSCPGKFVTRPRRRISPIQPAVARYLQSANATFPRRSSPTSSASGAGSYQRISMALLSRPPSGRRSLDTRPTHRKLSPYMESSIRRFASLGNSNLNHTSHTSSAL